MTAPVAAPVYELALFVRSGSVVTGLRFVAELSTLGIRAWQAVPDRIQIRGVDGVPVAWRLTGRDRNADSEITVYRYTADGWPDPLATEVHLLND